MSRMRRRGEKRAAGVADTQPATAIAFDELSIYRQARQHGKR